MVPNLGAASFLKDPEPLQMELQHSWCAVESEYLGGARFHFAHCAVILVVALEDINANKRSASSTDTDWCTSRDKSRKCRT